MAIGIDLAVERVIDRARSEMQVSTGITYEDFIRHNFSHVASKPLAPRHHRLWGWFEDITPEHSPKPRLEIWPRGGAKSSTTEMGVVYLGVKLPRRFVLYVSGTQEQADKHVQSIAALFERIGVDRQVGKHGHSKGWRRDQLRTAGGFNVAAIGLDTAVRGMKLDEFRPDVIVLDDIDGLEDTPETTAKKIRAVTTAILPARAAECAILVVQNRIREDGLVSRLADGRTDFLANVEVFEEGAIVGLEHEPATLENGRSYSKITKGEATWPGGQGLDVCQAQMIEWGLTAFLREAQHQVSGADGYFFNPTRMTVVQQGDLPEFKRVVRAWDLAATQGAGDFTVGTLMGYTKDNSVAWVLDVVRAQLAEHNVEKLRSMVEAWDKERFGDRSSARIPQDPGASGKAYAQKQKRETGVDTTPTSGSKAARAKGWAKAVNEGNVRLLQDGMGRTEEIDAFLAGVTALTVLDGETRVWHSEFKREHRLFREDEKHDHDDQVDSAADAFNDLAGPTYTFKVL